MMYAENPLSIAAAMREIMAASEAGRARTIRAGSMRRLDTLERTRGAWEFVSSHRHLTVNHYNTCMLQLRFPTAGIIEIVTVSVGWGSPSDRDGMDTVFGALRRWGIYLRYERMRDLSQVISYDPTGRTRAEVMARGRSTTVQRRGRFVQRPISPSTGRPERPSIAEPRNVEESYRHDRLTRLAQEGRLTDFVNFLRLATFMSRDEAVEEYARIRRSLGLNSPYAYRR